MLKVFSGNQLKRIALLIGIFMAGGVIMAPVSRAAMPDKVKAVYLPGERLNVRIIQEGREAGQGVGYLDDGTMVVVQEGDDYIGMEIDVVVTKVLQTAAGRMERLMCFTLPMPLK